MRFNRSSAGAGLLSLAAAVRADGNSTADLIRPASAPQVPPVYPIGFSNETFARPAGRLFDINGTVGYFAGEGTREGKGAGSPFCS